jgi:hypothetical protein
VSTDIRHSIIHEAGAFYMPDLIPFRPALALHLDAFDLVITTTRDPEGDRLLLDFCLAVVKEASALAADLAAKFTPPARQVTPQDESQAS